MISEIEPIAYGIGGLKPLEFWDMTPSEFQPYINARSKLREDDMKIENQRIGLLAAILQNGIPTVSAKKLSGKHKPDQYFKYNKPKTEEISDSKVEDTRISRANAIFKTMDAWVKLTSKRGA